MIDIDHFKRINDEHGHPAGDAVLREMAQRRCRDTLRTVDAVGRYGGEEFVAVLPHTGYEEARQTAERIRNQVQQRRFHAGESEVRAHRQRGRGHLPVPGIDSPDALLREADKALTGRKKPGGTGLRPDQPTAERGGARVAAGAARGFRGRRDLPIAVAE